MSENLSICESRSRDNTEERLTFGGTLDLVVETLYTLLDELVTFLAEFENVLSISSL